MTDTVIDLTEEQIISMRDSAINRAHKIGRSKKLITGKDFDIYQLAEQLLRIIREKS